MRLLLEKRGDEVSLLPALKRGGEGSIHPIVGEPDMVAKVFTEPTSERAEKLRAMIDNPPVVTVNAPVLLSWPKDRLLNPSGECVGYVMPYAKDKETFFAISHPGMRPLWAEDHGFRLRAARNIAAAVSAFHRHGYVLGDINELNVLVGPDASVAVVDTDSAQVQTTGQVFRCLGGKEGFTPPELIRPGVSFGDIDRHPHHDAFGLGVLIFQLLMEGNHPFAAHYVGPGTRPTLTERIAQGHWPYSRNRNSAYRPRREAPPLESLSPEIQRLMRDCFESGHKNPTCRPTPDDWCKALNEAEAEWESFPARLRHFYYRQLNGREFGKLLLETYEWVRPAAERVPRKVWAAACGVTGIFLLLLLCLSFLGSSAPGPKGPDGRPITGERTPRLWRDVQSNRQR
jgi:DNA-binding helix-hairpin-helix protein with protein kinase domain